MADLSKTVEIIFGGKDAGLGTSISSLTKGVDSFSGKIGEVTAPLAEFTDKILKVDTALAALAAGGLAVAVKAAG